MNLTRRHMGCGFIALCVVPALTAHAHREKTTVSEITWSEKDGYLYAAHKFHLHQTEVSLFEAGITHSPKFESLRARAQLALYVEKNFFVQSVDGTPLPLEVLGAEIIGRDVWVYQQAQLTSPPDGLIVNCNLLRDIIPNQINHVDVKLWNKVTSLAFRGTDGAKKALA